MSFANLPDGGTAGAGGATVLPYGKGKEANYTTDAAHMYSQQTSASASRDVSRSPSFGRSPSTSPNSHAYSHSRSPSPYGHSNGHRHGFSHSHRRRRGSGTGGGSGARTPPPGAGRGSEAHGLVFDREGAKRLVHAIKKGDLVLPDQTMSLVSDRLYQHVAMLAPDPSLVPELSHFRSGLAHLIDVHFGAAPLASSSSAVAASASPAAAVIHPATASPTGRPSSAAAREIRALLLKAMATMGEAMQELPPEVYLYCTSSVTPRATRGTPLTMRHSQFAFTDTRLRASSFASLRRGTAMRA